MAASGCRAISRAEESVRLQFHVRLTLLAELVWSKYLDIEAVLKAVDF